MAILKYIVIIAIGALGWLTLARIVRTQTLEIKSLCDFNFFNHNYQ